jgi:hypothetical protein
MNQHPSRVGWLSVRFAPVLIGLSAIGQAGCGGASSRKESSDSLKIIAMAMHNYHDTYSSLPAAGVADGEGELGISWRARLPGFYEGLQVPGHRRSESPASDWQKRVKWDEAWDSPANRELHGQMPRAYRFSGGKPGETVYQCFTMAPDDSHNPPLITALGDGRKGVEFRDIRDGTSKTILIVEADRDRAVSWMKPADLAFDPKNPKAGVGGFRSQGFLAAVADGSVRFISNEISDDVMRQLVLANDGGQANPDDHTVPKSR